MAEVTIRIPDKAIKIAAVVVGAIVLALFAGQLWSSGFFRPHYELRVFVPKLDGPLVGNQVRLNGLPVGKVSKVQFEDHPSDPDRSIRVTSRIEKQYQGAIRTEATARLERMGLLGERFVSIQAAREGEPIPAGGEIQFTPTYEPTAMEVLNSLGKRFGCKDAEKTTPETKPHTTN
jgi:phospholipid/cholesterol/gamma-HCH transport system substrate-binding protein